MRTVRTAIDSDAQHCAAIYAPFVRDTWISFETTPPDQQEMLHRMRSAHIWLVAEDGQGQVVGYAYGSRHREREAYVKSVDVTVYVEAEHSRQGFGKALYEALLPSLKNNGFHAAFAGIALPNNSSVSLHEHMGFCSVGVYREVGWKLEGWRDVGWWQRLL
jgi:L-amino acid N-acyltransferase YncA